MNQKSMMDLSNSLVSINHTFNNISEETNYYCDGKLICSIVVNNGGEGAFYQLQIHCKLSQQRYCQLVSKAIEDKYKLESGLKLV